MVVVRLRNQPRIMENFTGAKAPNMLKSLHLPHTFWTIEKLLPCILALANLLSPTLHLRVGGGGGHCLRLTFQTYFSLKKETIIKFRFSTTMHSIEQKVELLRTKEN